MLERIDDTAGTEAVDTPIGRVPTETSLDTEGLGIDPATLAELLSVDAEAWRGEIPQLDAHYERFGAELPDELRDEMRELEKRLAG